MCKIFWILFFATLMSCGKQVSESSETALFWKTSDEIISLSQSMDWDENLYAEYTWVAAFDVLKNEQQYAIGEGFDLPLSTDLQDIERRMLLTKKVEWGLEGFKETFLLPVASAKVVGQKLVVESSILLSGFEDLVSQKRVNATGTYVLIDHLSEWTGIRGQVLVQKTDETIDGVPGSYISAVGSPFKTWSYDLGGFVFAVPTTQTAELVSYFPYISEYLHLNGVSEVSIQSSSSLKFNQTDALKSRSTGFGKTAEWFDEQKKKWIGEKSTVNGDWEVESLFLVHYQTDVSQALLSSQGITQDNDLTAEAIAQGFSRGVAKGIDLDCDGSTLSGEGSYHSYLGGGGWHVHGDFQVIKDDAVTFPLTVPNIDMTTSYCLLSTGNSAFMQNPKGPLNPIGEQVSTFWQTLKIPTNAQSLQIRASWFTYEKPWSFLGKDRFLIRWDESQEVIASGHMEDLVDTDCLENNCGDWTVSNSLVLASSTDKGSSDLLQYPPRVICSTITEEMRDKSLTLRFLISDMGDQWVDSALAIDSIVFSEKNCNSSFTNEAFISSKTSQ
ncbi:MAG: hypothetical protein AB8C84_12915 [Oligoflexales bacterium]